MRILLSTLAVMLTIAPAYAANSNYDTNGNPEGSLEQASLSAESPRAQSMENVEPAGGLTISDPISASDTTADPEGSLSAATNQ